MQFDLLNLPRKHHSLARRLNPNGIHWAIANNPGGVFQRSVVIPLPDGGKDTRGPFLADGVLVAVPGADSHGILAAVARWVRAHLRVRDGLGVHDHLLVSHAILRVLLNCCPVIVVINFGADSHV